MKRILLFLASFICAITGSYSQATFSTGAMDVTVSEYGRIRLFTPDGTRHLQRASILVGTSSTAVFDYTNDAESLDPTVLVSGPSMSDFEIYGSYDNSYSDLPPAVIVKLNAYGWNNGAYTIVKFTIISDEMLPINAKSGMELIPELNQEYGFDTVTYNTGAEVVRFHRGTQENMGLKLLSASLSSLYSFEWYEDYSVDADYWDWMNHGSLQPQYVSNTVDGPVTITAQESVMLNNGQSFEVFYALALGANEQAMLANIALAEQKYEAWFAGTGNEMPSLKGLSFRQIYPNPCNESATVSYRLPDEGQVTLTLYDATGNELEVMISDRQSAGEYTFVYNTGNLPAGMYFCKLQFNEQLITNKLFVVK